MLHFDSSLLFVSRGSRVSRAPPYQPFPAFVNLNGRLYGSYNGRVIPVE